MIDLTCEQPLTLKAASRLPQLRRNGRPPHIASLYRWVFRGCRGIRLDSVVVAGSRVTTSESVDRWIAALTANANGESAATATRTPIRRKRDHDRAERNLADDGW
jgi:hypothetical protein